MQVVLGEVETAELCMAWPKENHAGGTFGATGDVKERGPCMALVS